MLRQRIITAVVLVLALILLTTSLSPFGFSLLITLMVSIAAFEWTSFVGLTRIQSKAAYIASVLILLAGLYLFLELNPHTVMLSSVKVNAILFLGLVFWGMVIIILSGYPGNAKEWNDSSRVALMGVLVLVPAWTGMVQLKYLDHDGLLVLLLVVLVSAADIAAYFTGRRWGKTKLAPALSPNKTREGFWGGFVATCGLAMLLMLISHYFFFALSMLQVLLLILAVMLVVVFSVTGDLLESMLKRNRQLKDSGRLLPGHGGIMDRIDSLTAAIPVFVLMISFLARLE